MKLHLIIIILFLSLCSSGQNLKWTRSLGGGNTDQVYSMVLDSEGNSYILGQFFGEVDFDPSNAKFNLTSSGLRDIFILKLDSYGKFLWVKSIGGKYDERAFSISLDSYNNILITGNFGDTVDFDPGSKVYNMTSETGALFILKLDVSGTFKWVKSIDGDGMIFCLSSVIDSSDNLYLTGEFNGKRDFDPSQNLFNLTSYNTDIFVTKFDSSGNLDWAKNMGGNSTAQGRSIAVDKNKNVYTVGQFQGEVDFNPGLDTFNLRCELGLNANIFISKLDLYGNFIWAKSVGKGGFDAAHSVVLDDFGNVYLTGDFSHTVDFDPGVGTHIITSQSPSDCFVLKLDSSGNFIWVKDIGGPGHVTGYSMAIDNLGFIYLTGDFKDSIDFNPSISSHYFNSLSKHGDAFILKLSNSGDFIWFNATKGIEQAHGGSIKIDSKGNIFVTGTFTNSIDFYSNNGFDLTSVGKEDIFVLKLENNTLNTIDTKNIIIKPISIWPNPFSNQINILVPYKLIGESFRIYNQLGQLMDSGNLINENTIIELDNISHGVYILKIGDDLSEWFKLIKD